MKNHTYFILFLLAFTVYACGNNPQPKQEAKQAQGWSEEEKNDFKRFCLVHVKEHGAANPETVCDCILNNAMEKHPVAEHADTLDQAAWETLIVNSNCIDASLINDTTSFWGETESKAFLKNCEAAARKKGDNETQAKTFCSCALEKVRTLVPNPHLTSGFTDEEYNSIMHDCEINP